MAENVHPVFVLVFTVFCCQQLSSNAQVPQTSSEVATLLNSFSKPLNLTLGRTFLTKVQNSETGLCLNLTHNETKHKTSVVDTSLVSIHVKLVNKTSFMEKKLNFPCLSCPNLTSTSPTAKFVFKNETATSCLAGSRFADDFQIVEQSSSRLTDVLSLSLFDKNMRFVNLSGEESVHLEMPLVKMPNTSRSFKLWCVGRPFNAMQWSTSFCTTNQTLISNNQTNIVRCNCSMLGYFTVYVDYSNSQNGSGPWNNGGGNSGGNSGSENPGGSPPAIPDPEARLSLRLDADCSILSNETTKANFLNSTKYSVALALNISTGKITNMIAYCGSIVVNFTLLSPDGTNSTLNTSLLKLADLVKTDSLKVPVENSNILPLTLGIQVDFNLTIPTSLVSQHYIRKTATTPTIKTTKIQPLVIDYTPFMISVAVITFLIVACICGTCCAHSWYLTKKKYTEFNSDKVKPKVEKPVVVVEDEEEAAPPEFPMTFTERPKVNERQMAKYDWARTSFAQEQIATSAFVTDAAAKGPRLIMDDSDEESDGQHPPGDVAINMEGTSESSENEGGTGESSSDEYNDEEEYDPRNYECEDDLQGHESRGSLPRAEEEIGQEKTTEHCENQDVQEDGGGAEDEERTGKKMTEDDRQDDEDDKQDDEDSRQDDDDDKQDDEDDKQDDSNENDNENDDVAQDDDATSDNMQDNNVNDDKDIHDNEDDSGTIEDNEGTPERSPSRSDGGSSRMGGVAATNGGLPEPSM
ncbi:uncharacterized protein LOC114532747 [Dendronephthya gigantea]|uniref:uncharacterized protein LOC114532747 n=1 Tax=Dendronephthya gigantea TaxID=151771 RepID=UPI001069C255|nr:uncharacterized protein LOC114532747 [Dendronephthya gigantea]